MESYPFLQAAGGVCLLPSIQMSGTAATQSHTQSDINTEDQTFSTLDWAHYYLDLGFSIIPLRSCKKTPALTSWSEYQKRQPSEEEIVEWFGGTTEFNIGIVTGPVSGLAVIDLDSHKALQMAKELGLPAAPIVQTARGLHYYYAHRTGVRNSQKRADLPEIDLRAEGGYIVAPPSIHESGTHYAWMEGCGLNDLQIMPLPDWVHAKRHEEIQPIQTLNHGVGRGERNNALARLTGLWVNEGDTLERALGRALVWNKNNTPPLSTAEVEKTVESIFERHQKAAQEDDLSIRSNWPPPAPLPEGLPQVPALIPSLLPTTLRARITDIAERMQCPLDFPAVASMIELAAIIGRQVSIRPKQHDDWYVVPNLWGMVVGRPGVMKSPALQEVLQPLFGLERSAAKDHEKNGGEFRTQQLIAKEADKVRSDLIRKAIKSGTDPMAVAKDNRWEEKAPPVRRRHIVNDTTVEKLGEILNENPNGVLIFRDELIGFLKSMEREGHESDRAFYLESWNGTGSFTYDRIGRGTVDIEAACTSILGGIQPGPLNSFIHQAARGGGGDDGFLQRFQLAVYPDLAEWKHIDRPPDAVAKQQAEETFNRLQHLETDSIGATDEIGEGIAYLHFDKTAQELFDSWLTHHEARLRTGNESEIIEAHLGKYRSLVPTLALILHLAEGAFGSIGFEPLYQAIAWADYLEQHARRIYSQALTPDMAASHALAQRITNGNLENQFTPRDVYRNQWRHLTTPAEVKAAIRVLINYDWLALTVEGTSRQKKEIYAVNPKLEKANIKKLTKNSPNSSAITKREK